MQKINLSKNRSTIYINVAGGFRWSLQSDKGAPIDPDFNALLESTAKRFWKDYRDLELRRAAESAKNAPFD